MEHARPVRTPRRACRAQALLAAVTALCVLLLAFAAAASAGHPKKGKAYKGVNSETEPVTLKVSKTGSQVASFKTLVGYNGACGQGGGPAFTIKAKNVPISSSGKFKAHVKGTFPSNPSLVKPLPFSVTGTFSGKTVHGTVKETGKLAHCQGNKKNPYAATFTATSK